MSELLGDVLSVPALLLGLRAGSCRLSGELVEGGAPVSGQVVDGQFRWRVELPEDSLPGDEDAWLRDALGRELRARVDGRELLFGRGHVSASSAEVVGSEWVGWSEGRSGTVVVEPEHESVVWVAELVSGVVPDHELWAGGHRLVLLPAADDARAQLVLTLSGLMSASAASDVLHALFLPVLRLMSLEPVVVAALWSADDAAGLVDFDAAVRSLSGHQLVGDANVAGCLDATLAGFAGLDAAGRRVAGIVIDMLLVAHGTDLEPSIAMAGAALELAAEEWLTGEQASVPVLPGGPATDAPAEKLAKRTRQEIADEFVALTARLAPGSEYASNARDIINRTFSKPAKDRLGVLLAHWNVWDVAPDTTGLEQFVKVRNDVVHARFHNVPVDERVRALLFGRWVLGKCVLRYLGWLGPVTDSRMP